MHLSKLALLSACSVLVSWGAITGVSVRGVTNTQAVLLYTAPSSSACTVEVSESATYSPLVHDVDGGLYTGAASDARATSVNSGTARQVVIGQRLSQLALDSNVYSRSLQAYTLHYYRITCGSDTATGTFTTANIPFGMTYQDLPQLDPATPGATITPTLLNDRTQTINDQYTGARIRRVSLPTDSPYNGTPGSTSSGPFLFDSGAPRVAAASLVGSPAIGYLAAFAQGSGGPGALYYIIPSTGEVRYLGWSYSVGVINPTDSKFYALSSGNIVSQTYSGDYSEASSGAYASFTPTTVLTGLQAAMHTFDSSFATADFTCYPYVAMGDYIHVTCGRGSQDSYAWIGVVKISTASVIAAVRVDSNIQCRWCGFHQLVAGYTEGLTYIITHGFGGGGIGHGPYVNTYTGGSTLDAVTTTIPVSGEPACSGCGTDSSVAVAQVGDVFQFDSEQVRIVTKTSPTSWVVTRGVNSTTAATHAPSATLTGACNMMPIFWKFLADPHGTDTTSTNFVPDAPWYAATSNGHNDMGDSLLVSESPDGWAIRTGDLVTEAGQAVTRDIPTSVTFAGAMAGCNGNSCVKHPSVGAPGTSWFMDFQQWAAVGGNDYTTTLAPVSGQLYKWASPYTGMITPKYFAIAGAIGARFSGGGAPHALLDVSPATLATTSGDSYKFCVANAVNECHNPSVKGDVFVNLPGSPHLYCNGIGDPCLSNFNAFGNAALQIGTSGTATRVITGGLAGLRSTNDYPTFKPLADGSYGLFAYGEVDSLPPSQVLMAKLPPFTVTDGVDRSKFIPASITLTSPGGSAVKAAIKFGYLEQGAATDYHCTSRAEACVANSAGAPPTDGTTDPFHYATTDSWTPIACTTSCTIVLPVLPMHVAYYQPVFYDSGNSVVSSGSPGIVGDFVQTTIASSGHVPVGISHFIDPWIDTWTLQTNVQGDNEMATAWAADSLLPLFADPTGLTVLFPVNDMTLGGCGGGVGIVQLSKLAGIGVTATSGNTLMTPVNCMTSYASATSPNGTWNDGLSWKGAMMAFRNNRLLAYFYRQANAGNAFTDSSLVISPDAGQTWVDYGRYSNYTVTGASCTSTTATLSATNALSAGQKIYVHDIGAVYDGKQTIATASGSQVTYAVSTCTGATGSTGYFGILAADGSAPDGTLGTYAMMWPSASGRQMVLPSPINYGQDGNYPTGIDPTCDPTAYVCGLSWDGRGSEKTYLWRVPLGQEMTKASYQWYVCSGYNAYWPVPDTVCDGNRSANWTSTQTSATPILYQFDWSSNVGIHPGEGDGLKYLPTHQAYLLMSSISPLGDGAHLALSWAPHPWGPFYPFFSSDCTERGAGYTYGCVPFWTLMGYGENMISTTPPLTQIRISAKGDHDSGNYEGSPAFWTVEAATGRVPFTGAARRADYMGTVGQMGMGHRFVSGNESDAISRRGLNYSLDWWTDVWDHSGKNDGTRPWFRDVISGGSKYFACWDDDGGSHAGLGHSVLETDGLYIPYGYGPRLDSNSVDSTWSASSGNSSWTFVSEFKLASLSNTPRLMFSGGTAALQSINLTSGSVASGDLCVSFGETSSTRFCLPGSSVAINTWYYLAISAEAQGSGYPLLHIYLGTAGTITEYVSTGLSTATNGTTSGGITKACTTYCASAPAITSTVSSLGGGNGGSLNGTLGEAGLYSGVVPSHVIREIYRTLRTDWARVGRGTI